MGKWPQGTRYDLFTLAEQVPKSKRPALRIDCGTGFAQPPQIAVIVGAVPGVLLERAIDVLTEAAVVEVAVGGAERAGQELRVVALAQDTGDFASFHA